MKFIGSTITAFLVVSSLALAQLPGDECATAEVLATATVTGSNVGFTTSVTDPITGCGYQNGADRWYTFTACANGTVTASLCGSTFDTVIAAYSGACGALVNLGCNDDTCNLQSQVTFAVTAGSQYWIELAGYYGYTGSYTLALTGSFGTALSITQPGGSGSLSVDNNCGSPFAIYFTCVTFNAGNYPNGYWGGTSPSLYDIISEFNFGIAPFVGSLDGSGSSHFGVPGGVLPPGLSFYAVTAILDQNLAVVGFSNPLFVTLY